LAEKAAKEILSFKGISKAFPGVQALNDVSFSVKAGCVHAIVGENGAGKSTLLKVLNGLYKADKGEIYLNGEPFSSSGPADALKAGISMIYQELNIIPEMTVLDNLYLGREKLTKKGFVDKKSMKNEAQRYFKEQGLHFKLDEKMRNLSIAQAQMLEIVKAISINAKVILMDEPTSSLTENEVDFLFNKIKELKERGITVIYISHKMEEVFAISDYITVLRDGEHISTVPASKTDVSQVIEMMVGRKMNEVYPKKTSQIGEKLFEVKNFNKSGVFKNINFETKIFKAAKYCRVKNCLLSLNKLHNSKNIKNKDVPKSAHIKAPQFRGALNFRQYLGTYCIVYFCPRALPLKPKYKERAALMPAALAPRLRSWGFAP
jgi:inositol transport system ATP-binding protein